MSTPNRLGTPMRQGGPPPASLQSYAPIVPPPVIPSSWIAAHEQRWLFVAVMGFLEVSQSRPERLPRKNAHNQSTKLWDIAAPYILTSFDPTWSTALRVQGFWTALTWFAIEAGIFAGVKLLRIPMVSPKVGPMLAILLAWNIGCWFMAEVSQDLPWWST